MDRGKDQIVFVEQRYASLIAGGIRWIKRQLGEEIARGRDNRTRSVRAGSNRHGARRRLHGCGRDAVSYQRRGALPIQLASLSGRHADPQLSRQRPASHPRRHGAGRRRIRKLANGVGGLRNEVEARAVPRSVRRLASAALAGSRQRGFARGFSTKRNSARMSLICAASRNLRPPNLTKGNVPAG